VSETIKVSKATKEALIKVAAKLQERLGRRVDLDEAIRHLIASSIKKPELLDRVFASAPSLSSSELYEERRVDEERFKRRYGL